MRRLASLGFVKVGNEWLKPEEVERERREAAEVAEAIRKNADDLKRIATELNDGKMTHDEALQFLLKHKNVHALPCGNLPCPANRLRVPRL